MADSRDSEATTDLYFLSTMEPTTLSFTNSWFSLSFMSFEGIPEFISRNLSFSNRDSDYLSSLDISRLIDIFLYCSFSASFLLLERIEDA